MPKLVDLAFELTESGDREDGLSGQFLEIALLVRGARLNQYGVSAKHLGRLVAKLSFDRAAPGNLKDDVGLVDPERVRPQLDDSSPTRATRP